MLSLQEISDRLEIQEIFVNYSAAVDTHDWALFDQIFTEDADLDYTEISDFRGNREELRTWLSTVMPGGRSYYHMLAAPKIVVNGDTADTVTPCFNPMINDDRTVGVYGHWYRDTLARTDAGWRITKRYFEVCYQFGRPSSGP